MALRCFFTLTSSTRRSRTTPLRDARYHFRTYLDETGKLRLNTRADRGPARSRGPEVGNPLAPVVPGLAAEEGFNRVVLPSGYFRGRLSVGGFFRDQFVLAGLTRNSPRIPVMRGDWTEQAARVWAKELGRYRSYAEKRGALTRHNFSLSLDSETTSQLTASGLSAPLFLEQVLEKAFARYLKDFGYDADDKLGYIYGFHMDTRNLHIQMSVFPRTKKGNIVKVTEMVRSVEKATPDKPFINNLTRYACEAAEELLMQYRGRTQLLDTPSRDLAHSLLRAQRLYDSFGKVRPVTEFPLLEQDLLDEFSQEERVPRKELPVEELLALFRRYAGVPAEEAKKPLTYEANDLKGDFFRRLSRLWLGFRFFQSERADRKKQEESGVTALPDHLYSTYADFWRRALGTRTKAEVGKDVSDALKRKRESVSRDIQMGMLPNAATMEPQVEAAGKFGPKFLVFLDKFMLFGSGVFFSRLTLSELGLAVQLRSAAVRFLQRENVGARSPQVAPPQVAPPAVAPEVAAGVLKAEGPASAGPGVLPVTDQVKKV